jgi:nicotinate-nucleotide--dimethylbenzimidazole phosphoribosyltransferase
VYWARRIVAALIVLILLVLLVPRACQAFFGPAEEPSSVEPEKSATEEETVGETEGVPVEGGIGEEVSPVEAAQGTYVAEAEVAGIQRAVEAPLGQDYITGAVNQTTPVPSFGAAQPAVQPLPPGPPILATEPVMAGPILPAEPVVAEPTLPAEPVVAEPTLPAEPFAAEPTLPAEPSLLDEALYFEEEPPFFREMPVSEGTFSEARAAAPEQKNVAETAGGAVAVAGSVSASAHSS